jgi:glycosyltransferase involved in cell wall biosynthesis
LHLLLVNQYYPPDTAPTGQYLHQLARALVRRGHAVTVLCSRRAYNSADVHAAEEVLDGVRVQRVRACGFGRKSGLGKVLDYATFYGSVAARLLSPRLRADLILALTTPPYLGLLARLAAGWKRAAHAHWIMDLYPDVLAAHGSMSADSLPFRFLAWLTRLELRGSPLMVTLGDDMVERARRYVPQADRGRTRVESIPLWHDPALAPWPDAAPPPFRSEQGWTERDLVLMYSGNMGRGHRFGEFLAAAAQLKSDPSIRWVFAGGGKRRAEVEEAARRDPGLNLRLLPYAPSSRLREHLCSADVHLVSLDASWQGCMVPSKFQGIFAVGKPVILVSSRANSLAQWIESSGGGWVVPENDIGALLAAIAAARDPEERRRRGAAARAFALAHFDAERNLRRLCELLEGCVRP